MRFVDRSGRIAPNIYEMPDVALHRRMIKNFLDAGIRYERPPSVPESLMRDADLRTELDFIFASACAYCESDITNDLQLDFHRPEVGAEGQDGQVEFQYYCWLTTEWENLYPVCSSCRRLKGNQYPVRRRGPLGATISHLRDVEEPLLLDPSFDMPTKHFHIDHLGTMLALSAKGEKTVELLSLNRPELLRRRCQAVMAFLKALQFLDSNSLEQFDRQWFDDRSSQFRGALLISLFTMLAENRRFDRLRGRDVRTPDRLEMLTEILRDRGRYFDRIMDVPPPPRFVPLSPWNFNRYVKTVEIENFRGVERATIEFPELRSDRSTQLGSVALLGENGTGKSTVLQAAAIGCLGLEKTQEIGITPAWCLRDGARSGQITVRFFDTDDVNVVRFSRDTSRLQGKTQVEVMVLGYGPYRLPARRELGEPKRRYRYRIHSLFDERHLVNGAFGLKKHYQSGDRESDAVRSLNELLSDQARARIGTDGQLAIEQNGRSRPMRDLSSGYKSVVTLATDIMDVMYEVWDGATSGQALILIDEVDAHLHPEWRQKIIEALRSTFPRAQFLFTTHDPLILRGLHREEIAVLENDDDQVSVTTAADVPVEGLTIDQLLTSELFGLDSTDTLARSHRLSKYYKLLARNELDDADRAELTRIKEELGPALPIGATRRERLVMAVVEAYLKRTENERRKDAWNADLIDDLLQEVEEAERGISA